MINVRDYKVEITKVNEADGGGYIAHIPELDCFGDGETVEEALDDVYAVAEDLIEIAKEDGKDIPTPQYYKDLDDFSGKLSIRLPKTLHKLVSQRAKTENCSINQLITTYIAMGIGDAFARSESLLEKQNEHIYHMFLLSVEKEMWKHTLKQQLYDFSAGFYLTEHKGGLKNEAGF
jgi:antitoxin HicB